MSWFSGYDYLSKIPQVINQFDNSVISLPVVPKDLIDWCMRARPIIDNKVRVMLPFWRDIYNDPAKKKMVVGGRQGGKSVCGTDVLAWKTTAFAGKQGVYCTYDDISKALWARQRYQIGTFAQNPILKLFLRSKLGSVGEMSLLNGSVTYAVTDHGQYHHVEGRSPDIIVFDETQYQDVQYLKKALQSLSRSQGDIWVLGIGGEAGSEYQALWEETDQCEWIFDDPYWREKLRFDIIDGKMQLVVGDYLMDVMRGRWKATKESIHGWRGFHVPQMIDPFIPLTMDDAINKYSTDVIFSIEYKKKYLSNIDYIAHVEGGFYKAVRRPITPDMVLNCMRPYRNFRMLHPLEIAEIKDTFGEKVKIGMGVDWGSGKSGNTVICIFIKWFVNNPSTVNANIDRIQLAYIDKRPLENQFDQTAHVLQVFKDAKCDIGVADYGYGHMTVKMIQDGGSDSNGMWFDGVGSNKFYGCRTLGTEVKPEQQFQKKIDDHGEEKDSLSIDKTSSILEFISLLEAKVVHPSHPFEENMMRSKLMIPFKKEYEHEVDFLVKEWSSLTRKDIDKKVNMEDEDPRKYAKIEFNHPPDSLMAAIYAKKALDLSQFWNYVSIR